MTVDAIASYLTQHGSTCTLNTDDPDVPWDLRPWLTALPKHAITIAYDPSTLSPKDGKLTVAATSTDDWQVHGLVGVDIKLGNVTIVCTADKDGVAVTMTADGQLSIAGARARCTIDMPATGGLRATSRDTLKQVTPSSLAQSAPDGHGLLGLRDGLTFMGTAVDLPAGGVTVSFAPARETGIVSFKAPVTQDWPLLGDGGKGAGHDPVHLSVVGVDAVVGTSSASVSVNGKVSIGNPAKTVDVTVMLSTDGVVSVELDPKNLPSLDDLIGWIVPGFGGAGLDQLGKGTSNAFDAALHGVRFTVDTAHGAAASVQIFGDLTLVGIDLDIALSVPPVTLSGALKDGTKPSLADIISACKAPVLSDKLAQCYLQNVSFSATPAQSSYYASLDVSESFALGPFMLTDLGGMVRYDAGTLGIEVSCTVMISIVKVTLVAQHDQGDWMFSGMADSAGLGIHDLLQWLNEHHQIPLDKFPDILSTFELTEVGLSYTVNAKRFAFHCAGTFQEDASTAVLTFDVHVDSTKGGAFADVKARLAIARMELDVSFSDGGKGATFGATYTSTDDIHLPLAYLAGEISPSLGDLLPTDLDIPLRSLGVVRVPGAAKPPQAGSTTDAQQSTGTGTGTDPLWLVSCDIDPNLSLTNLPVVGSYVPPADNVTLDHLDFIWSTRSITADELTTVNDLLKAQLPASLPRIGLILGVTVAGQQHSLVVPFVQDSAIPAQPPPQTLALAAATTPAQAPAAQPPSPGTPTTTTWLDVQKSLGPVSLQRIGVYYRSGYVYVVFDASFVLAAFSLDLQGLGLGFTPTLPPHITPALDGIGVALEEGALSVSGDLRRVPVGGDAYRFDGGLMVRIEDLQLDALGSYYKGPDPNDPKSKVVEASMFAFAVLDYPLGGPPAFFVNGLAAGFGVNRDLLVPGLADLPKFPLIQAVTGDPTAMGNGKVDSAVDKMGAFIPVRFGENWVALGGRFSTFELIETSALIVARWGQELEFDILGLSVVSLPADEPEPIAYAELALEATYKPAQGVLFVGGQLTPASFLLAKDCHLTGGFAFCSWMKDLGEAKAGDFVMTAGGYHPAYKVPTYYPQVPRLGFAWQVDSCLGIRGELYYALTPNALMAGGRLAASWKSGGLSAWFTAYADFLIAWRPFYYEADIGISIGASYVLNVWLTSFTVTVNVGVDLEIDGPPFAGTATVDLYVAKITVKFGTQGTATPDPISWTDFKGSMLPGKSQQSRALAAAMTSQLPGPTIIDTDSFCFTRVSGGLLKTNVPAVDGVDWVVEPELLELTTASVVPCTSATVSIDGHQLPDPTPVGLPPFGVGPVGIADGNLTSVQTVTITALDGDDLTKVTWQLVPVRASVPSAPWLKDVALAGGDPKTVNSQPSMVENALTGLVIRPEAPQADTTKAISVEVLGTDDALPRSRPPRSVRAVPGLGYDQSQAEAELTATLEAASPARDAVLARLRSSGIDVPASVDGHHLLTDLPGSLRKVPVLSLLGGQP